MNKVLSATAFGLLLLSASVEAGFFRSEPFPAQRYPGNEKPATQVARIQLMNSAQGVFTRINRVGEDRLWDDRRGWYNVWYGDFDPGSYDLAFIVDEIEYDRKGRAIRSVYDRNNGKRSMHVELQAGHSYRIRATDADAALAAARQPQEFTLEDLGTNFPAACFQINNFAKDADPSTGFVWNCK